MCIQGSCPRINAVCSFSFLVWNSFVVVSGNSPRIEAWNRSPRCQRSTEAQRPHSKHARESHRGHANCTRGCVRDWWINCLHPNQLHNFFIGHYIYLICLVVLILDLSFSYSYFASSCHVNECLYTCTRISSKYIRPASCAPCAAEKEFGTSATSFTTGSVSRPKKPAPSDSTMLKARRSWSTRSPNTTPWPVISFYRRTSSNFLILITL